MRAIKITIFALMLAALPCSPQSDSMIHVNQFPGITVGAKISAAMTMCPAAPVPCILVIDASLAIASTGTIPTLCANCYLYDFRSGPPQGSTVAAGTFTAGTFSQPFVYNVNSINPQTEFQAAEGNYTTTDALVSGISIPSTSTQWQVNGLTAYVLNKSTTTAGVGFYGQSRCEAASDGARCWGANLVVTDHLDNGAANPHASTLYGNEIDWAPTNAGDGGSALLLEANASIGMTGQQLGTGVELQAQYKSNLIFHDGFATEDGAAAYYGDAGAGCTSGTCNSQAFRFYYFNAGAESDQQIYVDSAGTFQMPTANATGNFSASGNIAAGAGANAVLRCTTAGTLPVGALTITAGNCGASTDTGLRVK